MFLVMLCVNFSTKLRQKPNFNVHVFVRFPPVVYEKDGGDVKEGRDGICTVNGDDRVSRYG